MTAANPIVAALEQMAKRTGQALSRDAGKAIKNMYREAGKRTEDVVRRVEQTDGENAKKLLDAPEQLGRFVRII